MCKKKISMDEAKFIFVKGKSQLLGDFISKKGRPFSAYLKLDGNRVKFGFLQESSRWCQRIPVVEG